MEIGPEVAPAGTVVAILLIVDVVTAALTPLNETILFAGVVLKFIPVIVTGVPTAPLDGLKPLKVGEGNTLKFVALNKVTPLTVTEILPVVAPTGTTAVRLVEVAFVTTADILLN